MKPIVKWQYEKLEDTLGLLEEHLTDQDCPCNSEGEACGRKHLKRAEAYAAETIAILARSGMSDEIEKLAQLAGEAKAFRLAEERQLCGQEVSQDDLVDIGWAGNWRKHFENLVIGACDVAVVEDPGDFIPWLADRMKSAAVDSALGEEPRWCFGVKTVNKDLGNLARSLGYSRSKALKLKSDLELPVDICKGQAELFAPAGVLDPYGSRCRDPKTGLWSMSEECGFEPAGIRTDALGMDGLTRYDFEFRIVSLDKLLVSHDPFNFEPNPEYPGELQPRLRERAATRIQVEKIAANLEPDALLTDFHTLDRGSPIIGPEDMAVEAGNGRVMGLIRSVREYPAKYELYRERLRDRARDFGLRPQDVDAVERPVLLRLRVTDVDRVAFTQEANTAATLAPSAIENARTDAEKITLGMLQELVIGENESIEDALRATRNKSFATRFLQKLPENVQASLVDAQGYLNRDGVHRMAMAIFVSAFQGDTGLRLAEKAFESLDMDVRNAINAIARSLGPLAQAEALIRSGERDTKLSIGDDLAQAVAVYSAIKHTPELTVDKYLAQGQLLERELTDFEEQVLLVFDQYRRSPKKLGTVLGTYARKVIDSPPPAQATLLPGVSITKEQLWEDAARGAEAEIPTMFEDLARDICELPSAR